jgi:hypothetical protein
MATKYGKTSRRITPSDISSVTVNNMTLISSGSDARGGYFYSGYVNTGAGGCGAGVEPSIFINIKNTALNNWRVITFKTFGTFTASCWSLNVRSTNCFELSQFTKQTSACDNEPTNAFHSSFYVGTFREFYQTRRRNSLSTEAGPAMQLSCNSTGASSIITISDIYVML